MIHKITSLFLIWALLLQSSTTFGLTPKDQKWVITLKSPSLSWQSPTWFTPFALEDAPDDIDYRLSILPHSDDKDEFMYIVLPTLGIITPIVFVPEWSSDHTAMTSGKEIDINKYLVEWVMHFAGSGIPWDVWNPVIFGHSNYFADKPGKDSYKSIFADIMNLDVGATDEMWIYTKWPDGEYVLKKFTIEESYETVPTDVGILRPKWGKELTVFACTNGLAGRWILRWKLIEDNAILVPYTTKYRIYDIIEDLKENPNKANIIIQWMKEIERVRANTPKWWDYKIKLKKYVINYIERELVLQYPTE